MESVMPFKITVYKNELTLFVDFNFDKIDKVDGDDLW